MYCVRGCATVTVCLYVYRCIRKSIFKEAWSVKKVIWWLPDFCLSSSGHRLVKLLLLRIANSAGQFGSLFFFPPSELNIRTDRIKLFGLH